MLQPCRFYIRQIACNSVAAKFLSTTTCRLKKEIRYQTQGNVTTVEAVPVKSEREGKVISLNGLGDARDTDPVSRLGLQLRYTDVRILAQFLRPDATILPRSVTGVSMRTQLHLEMMIERAKKAGLLPLRIDENGNHFYEERGRHRFNVYYDSEMIGLPKLSKKAFKYIPPD